MLAITSGAHAVPNSVAVSGQILFASVLMVLVAPLQIALADEPPPEEAGEAASVEAAANAETPTSADTVPPAGEPVDEITVTGQGNRNYFKRQMIRAETEFYDLFNELTSEEDFRIVCKTEKRHAFTNIKVRKCESLYESRIAYELTQRAFQLGSQNSTNASVPATKRGEYEKRVAERRQEQLEDMARVLEENPEFKEKLIALNKAKADYEESKSK